MKTDTPRDSTPMRKVRFLAGLVLSTCGVATMLMVAAGTLQTLGINGRLSLPAVGLCMIVGLMLLGGGFGIMATSAATFDDREFDRLMEAGNAPVQTLLDSSCGLDATRDDNDNVDGQPAGGPPSKPETDVDRANVSRVDPAESCDAVLQRPVLDRSPSPQTSV